MGACCLGGVGCSERIPWHVRPACLPLFPSSPPFVPHPTTHLCACMHPHTHMHTRHAGWDRECTRDEEWVREAGVDPRQPFYYVLPDEIDCSRLFQQREWWGGVLGGREWRGGGCAALLLCPTRRD